MNFRESNHRSTRAKNDFCLKKKNLPVIWTVMHVLSTLTVALVISLQLIVKKVFSLFQILLKT